MQTYAPAWRHHRLPEHKQGSRWCAIDHLDGDNEVVGCRGIHGLYADVVDGTGQTRVCSSNLRQVGSCAINFEQVRSSAVQ